MTFTMVCPGINEFNDYARWLEARRRYKDIIERLSNIGVTFEYLAENPLAKRILDEFGVSNTECVTALPELDETWYFKRMKDSKILPDDFKEMYHKRVTPDIKYKYPKATEFRVMNEYVERREYAFKDNLRKAANVYVASRSYVLMFRGRTSLFSDIEIKEDSGITYICYDYTDGTFIGYYGGTWVDWNMLVDILKMEIETEC